MADAGLDAEIDAAGAARDAASSAESDAGRDGGDGQAPSMMPGHPRDAGAGAYSDDDAGADQPRLGPWSAPKDRVPRDRNYVYVEGDPDSGLDQNILSGRWFLYTQVDAVFELRHVLGQTQIDVLGDQTWNGRFAGPKGSDWLQVGYYSNAGRVPFEQPGVTWMGEGLGCNTSTGWDECNRQCSTCKTSCKGNRTFCESTCGSQEETCRNSQ